MFDLESLFTDEAKLTSFLEKILNIKLFLDTYDKWEKGDLIERRFGPPSVDDVADLCASRIAKGSFLFTDGARAYETISKKYGYKHSYVDHGHGQYAKDVVFGGGPSGFTPTPLMVAGVA